MGNYFELLGLETVYTLDQYRLKSNFLQKQIEFHPDRANTESEKRFFLEKSIRLNEAKKILEDDYLRAEYLLKLAGIIVEVACRDQPIDSNYLEKILELNEQITTNQDANFLAKLAQQKEEEKKQLLAEIESAFMSKDLDKALELTLRLKYLTNLIKNIERQN